ncbi:MAG: DNA topoisomerase VI subunit B, partial [Bdellovibrionota bacterium]
SPFIKFKNASKETIDASDELVEEIRRALIQAGQKLSKHIRKEEKANELEEKIRHIEQFCPILVEGLCRITSANAARKKKAEEGLEKLLGRDARATEKELKEAHDLLEAQKAKGLPGAESQIGEKGSMSEEEIVALGADDQEEESKPKVSAKSKKAPKPAKAAKGGKKKKSKSAAEASA